MTVIHGYVAVFRGKKTFKGTLTVPKRTGDGEGAAGGGSTRGEGKGVTFQSKERTATNICLLKRVVILKKRERNLGFPGLKKRGTKESYVYRIRSGGKPIRTRGLNGPIPRPQTGVM